MEKEKLVDYVILAAIVVLLFYYFSPDMLFNNYTPTGGDYGSHIILADYAKDNLWNGKIIGFYPGWMAGMPMFQFYFILPYVMIALLSYLIPFNIAFKVISVLGIFLLPFMVYWCLKLLKFRFPSPILGAIASLFLLFDGSYSVWGGNIKSTLAGQFPHSISIALLVLFIGTLYYGMKDGKLLITNIAIFSLIFLSHLYSFIIAGFVVGINFLIILLRKDYDKIKYLATVCFTTFLLTAFWTIPFLLKTPFSSAPNDIWYGNQLFSLIFKKEFIAFYILLLFALFFYCYSLYTSYKTVKTATTRRKKKLKVDHEIEPFSYLLLIMLVTFLFTIIISRSRLLNIRFIPFIDLLIFILAGVGLAKLVFWKPVKLYLPFAVLAITVAFVVMYPGPEIKSWIKWNMEGVENKVKYENFNDLMKSLKNDDFNGRVQFEYSTDYNFMGTPRVFESSPRYTGKPVIEALLLESCLTFPFHYYMEKEMSADSWWPGFNISMPTTNIKKGVEDLRLYNVKRFVAYTGYSKKEIEKAKKDADVFGSRVVGNFTIYEINDDSEYVELLKDDPILVVTKNWKQYTFDWFNMTDRPAFLAFTDKVSDEDGSHFKLIYDEKDPEKSLKELYRESKSVDKDCELKYSIDKENNIDINTTCINKPVLVKFSYFPNWQAEGADKVYIVTPNLMLIFPQQNHVRLSYGNTFSDNLGLSLSLIGCITLIYLISLLFMPRWDVLKLTK